jgi:glycolate oxidase
VPTERLLEDLRRLVGPDYVLTAPEDVVVYEQDGSFMRVMPQIVVLPASTQEVAGVVRLAAAAGVPIVPRGAGTGLAGGAVPAEGGVVLTLARMNRILEVDVVNRIAVLEPGVVNLDVTKAVAPHGLFYAPDPSSQAACSIGGNVANNSGGPHTLAYGVTVNHVLGVEVVLADGSVVNLGGRVPDAPGYDLVGLFVGSEGTLGIVTRAIVRLMAAREAVGTMLAIFDDFDAATQTVTDVTAAGIIPAALEMMDDVTIRAVERGLALGFPLVAAAVLLIEVEGLREHVEEAVRRLRALCERNRAREVRVAADEAERAALWKGRKSAFGAMGTLAPNYYVHDGVVPRSRLPEIMRRVREIASAHRVLIANVFHAGDGNLHPNILFDIRNEGELDRVIAAGEEILRACVDAGGSLTGEHGIGLEKKAYMPWLFSQTDLAAMGAIKQVFDPAGRFNPAKLFPTPPGCGEVQRAPARIPAGLWI